MDAYPRRFIQVSLIYFAIGATLGTLMGAGAVDRFAWRYIHIHLNLLGFMTMMISGVAYHVLPRFSGRPVRHPRLIATHFWLANVGLLGMIGTRALAAAGITNAGLRLFPVFTTLAMLGVWVFVANAFPVLRREKAGGAAARVHGGMKVSEVLDRWPSTLEIFKAWGFTPLANPAARATFAKLLSVEKACRIHKVNAGAFLAALDRHVAGEDIPLPVVDGPARADARVGDLIRAWPAAKVVLERRFGTQTLTCPGLSTETLRQAAEIHGVEPEALVAEVNEEIRTAGARRPSPGSV